MSIREGLKAWFIRSSLPRYFVYCATVAAIVGTALKANLLYWLAGILAAAATLWSSEQKAASQKLLQEQGQAIAELTARNAALVTGGDSFCYLEISNLDEGHDAGMCVIVQQGESPLYDVKARVVDLQRFAQLPKPTTRSALKNDLVLDIGDMAAGSATMELDQPFILGKSNERDFNVFFSARNGFFNQKLRFRRVNGQWARRTVVTRDGAVIFETADEKYPAHKQQDTPDAAIRQAEILDEESAGKETQGHSVSDLHS